MQLGLLALIAASSFISKVYGLPTPEEGKRELVDPVGGGIIAVTPPDTTITWGDKDKRDPDLIVPVDGGVIGTTPPDTPITLGSKIRRHPDIVEPVGGGIIGLTPPDTTITWGKDKRARINEIPTKTSGEEKRDDSPIEPSPTVIWSRRG